MRRLPETTIDWYAYFSRLYLQADQKYQETGEQKYDTQRAKYDTIRTAFEAQIREQSEEDGRKTTLLHNVENMIGGLVKPKYTKDEVAALLRKAALM